MPARIIEQLNVSCLNKTGDRPKYHRYAKRTDRPILVGIPGRNSQPRILKMKKSIPWLTALLLAGLLASCSKSDNSSGVQLPDPATQPEAQAALFQRTADRVKSLIERKDYKQAQGALDAFKKDKLTAEQQKTVDQLQTQIPKAN